MALDDDTKGNEFKHRQEVEHLTRAKNFTLWPKVKRFYLFNFPQLIRLQLPLAPRKLIRN
jgi:hypothetical protein